MKFPLWLLRNTMRISLFRRHTPVLFQVLESYEYTFSKKFPDDFPDVSHASASRQITLAMIPYEKTTSTMSKSPLTFPCLDWPLHWAKSAYKTTSSWLASTVSEINCNRKRLVFFQTSIMYQFNCKEFESTSIMTQSGSATAFWPTLHMGTTGRWLVETGMCLLKKTNCSITGIILFCVIEEHVGNM